MHFALRLSHLLPAAGHALAPKVEECFEGATTSASIAPGAAGKTTTLAVEDDPADTGGSAAVAGIYVGASTPHIGSGYLGGGTAESGTRTVTTLSTVFAGSADHTRNADGLINMDATDNADDSTIAHNRCDSGTTGKDGAAEELGASVGAPTTGASIRPADAIPVGGVATFEVSSAPEQPRRSRRPDGASKFARR